LRQGTRLPTGFDYTRKTRSQNSNGTDEVAVPEFAPSLAEADAILAQFGYEDAEAVQFAEA